MQKTLHFADGMRIEMEDARRQRRIGTTRGQDVIKVLRISRPPAGNDGNAHRFAELLSKCSGPADRRRGVRRPARCSAIRPD